MHAAFMLVVLQSPAVPQPKLIPARIWFHEVRTNAKDLTRKGIISDLASAKQDLANLFGDRCAHPPVPPGAIGPGFQIAVTLSVNDDGAVGDVKLRYGLRAALDARVSDIFRQV